ncbi:hypothetical protein DX933_08870 [Ornithinibacillus gellani]|nr:hypothetical protein DX933_08870 [Ornithinibacillus gellani]
MTETEASTMVEDDVQKNKGMAILAYIGLLFIVPLLAAKESKYAMYHVNQGIILSLFGIGLYVVGTILPVIGWLLILPVVSIAWLVMAILGILNAANGKEKPLPIIGKYKIIS